MAYIKSLWNEWWSLKINQPWGPALLLTSEIQDQLPWMSSFHKDTLLSPPETASIFPETDQLTCQTTSSKVCRVLGVQLEPSLVQMMTRLSWEQLAIMVRLEPIEGAQATSRTQSEWPSNLASQIQLPVSSWLQILTQLSHPGTKNK